MLLLSNIGFEPLIEPILTRFWAKTAKIRQKSRKNPDRPCVFGVPADTMMTLL